MEIKSSIDQKISPFLWFNNQAEEAVNFYTAVFKNAKIGGFTRYGEGAPFPKGTVMSATFQLEGLEFMALNAGPHFQFTPAISFFVKCRDQEEVDYFWDKLSEGGREDRCGWLQDKFGLSWQIIPDALGKLLHDPNPEKAQRAMQAMMGMKKIIVAELEEAVQVG